MRIDFNRPLSYLTYFSLSRVVTFLRIQVRNRAIYAEGDADLAGSLEPSADLANPKIHRELAITTPTFLAFPSPSFSSPASAPRLAFSFLLANTEISGHGDKREAEKLSFRSYASGLARPEDSPSLS